MKDIVDFPAVDLATNPAKSNPRAASVRLRTLRMSKAKAQRSHDYRKGEIPSYVDLDRIKLNRTLETLRPLTRIHAKNAELREKAGRVRKMKSNAAVVVAGVITFGHLAAGEFSALPREQQDKAFRKLAQSIADKLDTGLESLVVHLDETTIHAHFMLRGYNKEGLAVSDTIKLRTTSEIQDMAHEVLSGFCPGIERGHRKQDRLAAGERYADTLHRSVRQLHQDLPAEIAAVQDRLTTLKQKKADLEASTVKTREYIRRLTEDREERTAKEEKRLKTYEERVRKKEVELAALSEQQEAEQRALDSLKKAVEAQAEANEQRQKEQTARAAQQEVKETELQGREEMIAAKEAELETDRAGIAAGEVALLERKAKLAHREQKADRIKAEFDAGLRGLESLVDAIESGTMRVNPQTNKIAMKRPELIRPLPQGLKRQLIKPAFRLVRMLHDAEERSKRLDNLIARVKAWLERDDLTDDARKDGEDISRDWGPM